MIKSSCVWFVGGIPKVIPSGALTRGEPEIVDIERTIYVLRTQPFWTGLDDDQGHLDKEHQSGSTPDSSASLLDFCHGAGEVE